jgi:hypothetical protein
MTCRLVIVPLLLFLAKKAARVATFQGYLMFCLFTKLEKNIHHHDGLTFDYTPISFFMTD